MRKNRLRLRNAVLAGAAALSLLQAPVFAAGQGIMGEPVTGRADRTILMYVCGSNIESDDANATAHFKEILQANFSRGESVRYVIMTGGANTWHTDGNLLYDPATGKSIEKGISTEYNQIWEAYGADEENAAYRGKMVLLDGDGVSGDGATAKRAEDELMTDPKTLKAFINYAADLYPAEKYDLILCDHGGGPTGGFGSEDHDPDGSWMSYSEIIDAIADNHVTENNGKFDILNFDACIMGSAEYSLALSDYVDYYIASPYTIPGYGEFYTNWLNRLGKEPKLGGYELGKVIVDDFYDYYMKMEEDGLDHESTLAVIDLKRLMDSGFTEKLLQLDTELEKQARSFQIYDEIYAIKRSINYVSMEFFDLGNLTSSLGVSVLEATGASDENAYTELSDAFRDILNNKDIIYAKGTPGIVSREHFYRDKNGQVNFGKSGTSGMYIYMPNVSASADPSIYVDSMKKYYSTLPEGDIRRKFFEQHADTVLKYSLIYHSGAAVGDLIEKGTPKSGIDYDRIREYWRYDIEGNMDGEDCPWNTIISKIADRMGGETELKKWLEPLVLKQAEDAIDKNGITAYTVKEPEGTRPRIYFKGVKKQIFDSVDIDVYVTLPVAEAYIKKKGWDSLFDPSHPFGFQIGTVEGVQDYEYEDLEDYHSWLKKDSDVWDVPVTEKKWYVIKDADGINHVADAEKEEDDVTTVVPATGVIMDGSKAKGSPQDMKLFFEKGVLLSVNVRSPEGGYYTIAPAKMTGSIELTLCRPTEVNGVDVMIPISKPFLLNAKNASLIRLDYVDIDEIPDVQGVNDKGDKATYKVVVRDIYSSTINIQNKVNAPAGIMYSIRFAKAEDAVYNGKKQMPKITVDGSCFGTDEKKTLTEGVDYRIFGEVSPVLPGTYTFLLFGKGDFVGSTEISFTIKEGGTGEKDKKGWKRDSKGWWYSLGGKNYPKNKWLKIDGKWYFFDKEGYMEANAYRQGYYLDPSGAWDGKAKITGWKKDSRGWWFSTGGKNYLKNCWKKINGNWYYFKSNGYIAINEFVQGWWLNKAGAWKDPVRYKWYRSGSRWWYGVRAGWYAKSSSYIIDGKKYSFDRNGYMK